MMSIFVYSLSKPASNNLGEKFVFGMLKYVGETRSTMSYNNCFYEASDSVWESSSFGDRRVYV